LTLYDPSFVGSRAHCTLRLGNAHLQSGDIEEAARVVGDGALLAARAPSARLIKEVHATRARMQPWQTTPAVRTLDEQLVGCGLGLGHDSSAT
jgi:hypothetical protein